MVGFMIFLRQAAPFPFPAAESGCHVMSMQPWPEAPAGTVRVARAAFGRGRWQSGPVMSWVPRAWNASSPVIVLGRLRALGSRRSGWLPELLTTC